MLLLPLDDTGWKVEDVIFVLLLLDDEILLLLDVIVSVRRLFFRKSLANWTMFAAIGLLGWVVDGFICGGAGASVDAGGGSVGSVESIGFAGSDFTYFILILKF